MVEHRIHRPIADLPIHTKAQQREGLSIEHELPLVTAMWRSPVALDQSNGIRRLV